MDTIYKDDESKQFFKYLLEYLDEYTEDDDE